MNIVAKITGIEYEPIIKQDLEVYGFHECDINEIPPSAVLKFDGNKSIAISKWVSPKRTRSYPYERVYNTLVHTKKATIIPIVKDEGKAGDRDYIQWDTIALMSLLDVYVIISYYVEAEKRVTSSGKIKITKQKFDNSYVKENLSKILKYHSSALHWNLKQIEHLSEIIAKAKTAYAKISKSTGVELKSIHGIDSFADNIKKGRDEFMNYSRLKAHDAQSREFVTSQPKEHLATKSKARITIKNYLGGNYFLTVDEIKKYKNKISLLESKHSRKSVLPSNGDIKDGLLKMILFTNLEEVAIDGKFYTPEAVLNLTSSTVNGNISNVNSKNKIENWIKNNKLTQKQIEFLNSLFKEAKKNKFKITIKKV